MTTTPVTFFEATLVSTTESTLYQVPVLAKAVGKYMYIYNSGASPVAITVNLPKKGGVSGPANEFFYGLVPAKKGRRVYEFGDKQMEPGATIRVTASIDNVANVSANGVEVV